LNSSRDAARPGAKRRSSAKECHSIAQQQRVRRVDHIGRGKTVVHERAASPDRFRQIGRERDDVVVGSLLDFVDAFDGKLCPALICSSASRGIVPISA